MTAPIISSLVPSSGVEYSNSILSGSGFIQTALSHTYDGSDIAVYFNNILATSSENPKNIGSITIDWSGTDGTKDMCLGGVYRATVRWPLDGKIDQCAIWSAALDANQRTELFNGGGGLPYSSWT